MPYGRCVVYSVTGDEQETVNRARDSLLPVLKRQQGFIAYGVIGQSGQIFSMSAWESEDDAKAADEAAKQWVTENMDAQVVTSVLGDFAWLEFAER
jgi:heme-degrading monooxygenase HmoA